MNECQYVISIEKNVDTIFEIISDLVRESKIETGYCSLKHQLKLYLSLFEGTVYADQESLGSLYSYDTNPRMEYFKNDVTLGELTLKDMPGKDISTVSDLQK